MKGELKWQFTEFGGMVDIEIEADSEEEALEEFEEELNDIVASCVDIELIEED